MNEGLFTAFQGLPEWERLLLCLKKGGCTALSEIAEGERPILAAALAAKTGRPVLLVSEGDLSAQRNAQDLERMFGKKAPVLPARDLQFSRAAMSRESTWQRLDVLDRMASGESGVYCAPIEALLERCLPPEQFRAAALVLSEGQRIGREKLMEALIHGGYEREAMVEGRGQCAGRGSIVDVFPSNAPYPIRIEFFDDEIDSIRSFDPVSQRSTLKMKKIRVAPASECLPQDPQKAAERFEEAIRHEIVPFAESRESLPETSEADFLNELDALELEEDLLKGRKSAKDMPASEGRTAYLRHRDETEIIRAGHVLRTAPVWMNTLCEKTVFTMEYLRDPILLFDRPDQYPGRVKVAEKDFEESLSEAAIRGDAFEAQKELRFTYDDLLKASSAFVCVTLSDILGTQGRFSPADVIAFGSKPTMPYQSRLEPMVKDLAEWREKDACVVLLAGGEARGRRLQHSLEEFKTHSVYSEELNGNLIRREIILLPVSYSKGFVHFSAGLCVIADSDIFGTAYQRARKKHKAGEHIASFTDLKNGDYIVHDLHGIGIFRGIVQRQSDGKLRDYLYMEYAGSDKLYIPADQFDRVTKFIGGESNPPKLNHLGGSEWQKQKSKVKAGLKELAFSLAELYATRSKTPGYAFSPANPWQEEFNDLFPFELTDDQQKAVAEIEGDMESPRNMDRLLCGDVGYGKTEVALRAVFKCVTEGKQAAILAPTTILVQQHFNTIRKRFSAFPSIRVEMLSRFRSAKEQKEIIEKANAGEIDILVGTHRLLNKAVKFKDLGLLVIDEEQRFGVSHKESIQHYKSTVDVLTLSATPIPRTLHMSMVGIRDMSLLETPPEERLPVKTFVMEYSDAVIREAIRREMARGGQVFFLYNRVRSIEQMYQRIKSLVPDARVGIAHGQMKETALEDIMLDFYAGAYDVLLCTTIVESGLDVPDANTLIVFDADRFGLAQLYQIRGRVGRSSRQAYAYFTIRESRQLSETAQQRLDAIREFTEFGAGYRIAMRDLDIRGAGDLLGPQQSGHMCGVGYDMYVKLIDEAICEVQGKEIKPDLDTRIELNVNAYLPQDYIAEEKVRIEIYKRIAMVEDNETRMEAESELIDRFGDVPAPAENLIRVAQLRGITRKLGIANLSLKPNGVMYKFDEHYLPDTRLLFEAVSRTDPRLQFMVSQKGVLMLNQKNLTPENAMETSIFVLERLLEKYGDLEKEAAGEESRE